MKKLISILSLSLCILFAATLDVEAKKKKVRTTTSYSVKMHCEDCKEKLMRAIPFEKGVKKLNVSLETNKVVVVFDPAKTDSKKIKTAIEELKFVVADYKEIAPVKKKAKK